MFARVLSPTPECRGPEDFGIKKLGERERAQMKDIGGLDFMGGH